MVYRALRSESASATAILSQEQHLRDVLTMQETALAKGGCYALESCSLDMPALDCIRLTADHTVVFGHDGCLGMQPQFVLPVMNIARMAATVVNKDADTQRPDTISTRVLLSLTQHDYTPGSLDSSDDESTPSQLSFLTSGEFVQASNEQLVMVADMALALKSGSPKLMSMHCHPSRPWTRRWRSLSAAGGSSLRTFASANSCLKLPCASK